MKLYTVSVTTEFVVVAEDEEGAERAGMDALGVMGDVELDVEATPMRYLPFGWDGGELPFVDPDTETPEVSVNEWIAAGAAPELTKRMAKKSAGQTGGKDV